MVGSEAIKKVSACNLFCCQGLFSKCKSPGRRERIYKSSQRKYEREINIVEIIKQLREIKTITGLDKTEAKNEFQNCEIVGSDDCSDDA